MGSCLIKNRYKTHPSFHQTISSSLISDPVRFQSKLQTDINDDFSFMKVLGHGQSGTVRQAIKTIQSIQKSSIITKYAIKSIQKSKFKNRLWLIQRQIQILQSIDHPNIVKLLDIYQDSKQIHLVMEYCQGQNLLQHLMSKRHLQQFQVAKIMKKLLQVVNYLHSLNICHRDLKPENFMFSQISGKNEIKLVDLGISEKLNQEGMMSLVSSTCYSAPEVFTGYYGKQCDVWSLGVICYFLLSGKHPYQSRNQQELFIKMRERKVSFSGQKWKKVSIDAKKLLRNMLVQNPKSRISVQQALRHR